MAPYSQELIPLDIIHEEEDPTPLPRFARPKSSPWDKCKSYTPCLHRRYVTIWKCSHLGCNARPWSRRALLCRCVRRPLIALVFILGILKILSIAWTSLIYLFPDELDSALDGWVFPHADRSLATTHGVIPVACHSHHDYWRRVPLYSALAAGCISVDADIWLSKTDELLVGQSPRTLSREKTLQSMYLTPLLKLLKRRNGNTRSVELASGSVEGEREVEMAGVFATDPDQSLTLLLEFKGGGSNTNIGDGIWSRLVEELDTLRDAGYLTHFNGSDVIPRPLTIVVSGTTVPFDHIQAAGSYRDIFYDASLLDISVEEETPYTAQNSVYASADFRDAVGTLSGGRFSQAQLGELRRQIRSAHERGLKVRYVDTPAWPRGLRNHVWHVLVREGVDVLGVADLREGTSMDWRRRRSWLV